MLIELIEMAGRMVKLKCLIQLALIEEGNI